MDNELEQLGERIAEQAAHLDAAMHRLLADLRAFDLRGGWHTQGAMSCAHWLAWRVGWELVTARDHVRVARKLAEFPAIDDALRCGEVSYSKVRAMLRVATPENEVLLLEHAKLMTASQLDKLCRKYALVQRHGQDRHPQGDESRRYVRRRDTEDGMVKIEAVLHPEEAELVWTMLDHAAARLAHESVPDPGDDSAETSTASQPPATLTAPLSAPAVQHGTDAAACVIDDHAAGVAARPIVSPTDDSAESPEEASSAARSDIGLVTPLPADAAPDSRPAAAACMVSDGLVGDGIVGPITGPIDDSAESFEEASPAVRPHVGVVTHRPVVSAPDSRPAAAAHVVGDGMVGQVTGPIDDSAESFEEASPAVRPRVGVVTHRPVVSAPNSRPAAAAHVVGDGMVGQVTGPIDDSAESGDSLEPCLEGSMQPLSYVPPRSFLDQRLDEADSLRGADAAAHDEMRGPSDAECGSGLITAPARCGSEAAGHRREASPLRERAAAARRAFNRVDALMAVAQGHLRGSRPERSPVEVVLTIPASSLRAGAALDPVEVGEMGESFLSGESARRLSCDAGVVDVIQDEHGTPLSVGRKRRTIGGALKRALRKRDGMCGFPGCTNRIFLEGHHIQHWANGGETSLRNTTLLCSLHHRYVHEYGYAIDLGPDQRPRFRDPHGRPVAAVPEHPHAADLGWPHIRATNEALQIDADTIAGPWDGTPIDYGRIVGHLATADGLA